KEGHVGPILLRVRHVVFGECASTRAAMVDRPNNTNDHSRLLAIPEAMQLLANRVLPRPEFIGQVAGENRDTFAVSVVTRRKITPGNDGNSECAEITTAC